MKSIYKILFTMFIFCCISINTYSQGNWSSLGTGTDNSVIRMGLIGSTLYVGGQFTTAGGITANGIAKWNGTSWSFLGSGVNGDGIFALTVSGSDLYVGGGFTTAGGLPANNIAKWNGTSWSALSTGTNEIVYCLAADGNIVYAGGQFTTAGGVSANGIAKWTGTSWEAMGTGISGSYVLSIAVSGSDIYAGGEFSSVNGMTANNIAKWNGSNWTALGSGLNGPVSVIYVLNNEVYVGGSFSIAGGITANNIAKWNGSSWTTLGSGFDGAVECIKISNGILYAGGWFTAAGNSTANYIARWNGTEWFALGEGMNNNVIDIVANGNEIYAGGNFTQAGQVQANYIAKYNQNISAERYWVGGSGNWNDVSHWSLTSGGMGGAPVPGSTDAVVFDINSGNGNTTVNIPVVIKGLNLATGYSGTIDASTQNVTIGTSGYIQNSGTFTAPGVGYWMIIGGNFTSQGGNFDHNNGNLRFSDAGHITFIPGSVTFGNVTVAVNNLFNVTGTSSAFPLNITGDLNILSAQVFNGGTTNVIGNISINNIQALTGVIDLKGNLTSSDINFTSAGVITFSSTVDQNITSAPNAMLPGIRINKPSGILDLSGVNNTNLLMGGSFINSAGTVIPATFSSIRFSDAGHITFSPGILTFGNVTVAVNNLFNVTGTSISSPLNITGDLNIVSAQVFNAGVTNVNGNISINNIQGLSGAIGLKGNITSTDAQISSSGILTLNGSGDQHINTLNADLPDGLLKIDKSSGIVYLDADLTLNGSGQDILVQSGTLHLNGYNITVPDLFTLKAGASLYPCGNIASLGGPSKVIFEPGSIILSCIPPPLVTTNAATNQTSSSASVNGTVNPNGTETYVFFEWATDNTFETYNSTTSNSIGSGTTDVQVSATITGLYANTTYYYRVVAENSSGTSRGDIRSFNTHTLQGGVQLINAAVNGYISNGILSSGNGNALLTKLNAAINQINSNNFTAAINQMNAFINQVNAFVQSGRLTQSQAQALIDAADSMIGQLSDDSHHSQTEIPKEFKLDQNYPNPFNPFTNINYELPSESRVSIIIYDITGRKVSVLIDESKPAGFYTITFEAFHLASGVYFYRIEAKENSTGKLFTSVKKMLLVK